MADGPMIQNVPRTPHGSKKAVHVRASLIVIVISAMLVTNVACAEDSVPGGLAACVEHSMPVAEPSVDTAFHVGFGRRVITPEESLWMSGDAGPERLSNGVLDDLHVQAMAILDEAGTRALLLRIDVCTMRDATITQICHLITQQTGLMRRRPPSRIHANSLA